MWFVKLKIYNSFVYVSQLLYMKNILEERDWNIKIEWNEKKVSLPIKQ